jgi:hypothetical protein
VHGTHGEVKERDWAELWIRQGVAAVFIVVGVYYIVIIYGSGIF